MMDLHFYNMIFKVATISVISYVASFLFLFLSTYDGISKLSKNEWLFVSLTPLLIMIIVLLLCGINLTGGF